MGDFFFYGTLCQLPLLRAVLGRAPAVEPARLPGYRVYWAEGQAYPMILPDPAGQAEGLVLRDASASDVARLDHYEGGFGYRTRPVALTDGPALVYFPPEAGRVRPGAPWSLAAWAARWLISPWPSIRTTSCTSALAATLSIGRIS